MREMIEKNVVQATPPGPLKPLFFVFPSWRIFFTFLKILLIQKLNELFHPWPYIKIRTADPISSAPFSRIPLLKIEDKVKPRGKYEFPPPPTPFFLNGSELYWKNSTQSEGTGCLKRYLKRIIYHPPNKKLNQLKRN